MMAKTDQHLLACDAEKVNPKGFNRNAVLPFGLTVDQMEKAMTEYVEFICYLNTQLHAKGINRLETMLMSANFSSMVGEFMHAAIAKNCPTLVKNQYHNGHPDLIPAGRFPNDAVQYAEEGIEIKASRYDKAWQGHNAEACWLMVFVYEAGRPTDEHKEVEPTPFKFKMVCGAQLTKDDWQFAGRSETSRRTITASVKRSGYDKMMANWIYKRPSPNSIWDAFAKK
jgi:hypothetical protein